MTTNQDVLLSQLDTDNPDFSKLEKSPANLQVVDNQLVVVYSDSTTEEIGPVGIPVDKTIAAASINLEGNLIVQYSDGSSDNVGKLKGVREVPYSTIGSGLLTNQNEFELTFTPVPINESLSLKKGVLSPQIDKLKYENHSRFLALSNSQFGGRYVFGQWFTTPLNYAQVNNLNLTLKRSVITLPPGEYYIQAYKTSLRNFHSMPSIVVFNSSDSTASKTLLFGQMSIGFASSTASSTGYVSGKLTFTEETEIALMTYCGDNRLTYSPHHAGVGVSGSSAIQYNTYATLDIWRLVNG